MASRSCSLLPSRCESADVTFRQNGDRLLTPQRDSGVRWGPTFVVTEGRRRTIHNATFLIAIFAISVCTGASFAQENPSPIVTARHAGGSIYPTTSWTPAKAPFAAPSNRTASDVQMFVNQPGQVRVVLTVCMATTAQSASCGVNVDNGISSRCFQREQYEYDGGYIDEPLTQCMNQQQVKSKEPPHVAFCNLDAADFSACLSAHASALVRMPLKADTSFSVTVHDKDGGSRTFTVLMPGGSSIQDAEEQLRQDRPDALIVSVDHP
jgi:hypothetical protein